MVFIHNLTNFDSLVDIAHTLPTAQACEVYHQSGDASRFKVIKNMSTGRDVCAVSDQYQILQHRDALNEIVTGLQAAGLTGAGQIKNYDDTISVELYFDNFEVRDHSTDGGINLGLRFLNSFNKSVGFSGSLFGWRQVCANGMCLSRAVPNAPQMYLKHVGNLMQRITDTVARFVSESVRMEGSLLTLIDEAQHRIITFETRDQLTTFMAQYVGSEKRANTIIDMEEVELDTNYYDLYNALTSYTSHFELSFNMTERIQNGAQHLLLGTPMPPVAVEAV